MTEAFVIDTHPLIWLAAGSRRKFGRKALAAIDSYQAGELTLYVPAPVVAETWFTAKRGAIRLETTLARWWQRIANPLLRFEPLFAEDVFTASELNWEHIDAQDRLIVATAIRLDIPLITADSEISDWGGVPVIW